MGKARCFCEQSFIWELQNYNCADNILFLYFPTSTIPTLSEEQTTAEFFEELQTNSKTI